MLIFFFCFSKNFCCVPRDIAELLAEPARLFMLKKFVRHFCKTWEACAGVCMLAHIRIGGELRLRWIILVFYDSAIDS